jgi:putative DNA primase/helicase
MANPKSRHLKIRGVSGWEHMGEVLHRATRDHAEPSDILILGGDGFFDDLRSQLESDHEIDPDHVGTIVRAKDSDRQVTLKNKWCVDIIASKIQALEMSRAEVRLIRHVIIWDSENTYMKQLLAKCPDLTVWEYLLDDPEQEQGVIETGIERNLFLKCRWANEITPSVTEWVWPGFIPKAKHIHMFGPGGVGKSKACEDFLSRVSNGKPWADGRENLFPPCNIAVVTFSEDTYEDIVIPSLMLHQADLKKFCCIDGVMDENEESQGSFSLDKLEVLQRSIAQHKIGIVYINPLSAGFGSGKMNDQQDVRRKFDAMNRLADETGVTVITVGHDKKGLELSASNKASGSQQITAGVRAAFYFMKGKNDDPCSMVSAKQNLSQAVGLKYRIEKVTHPLGADADPHDLGFGKIKWLGKQNKSADELLEDQVDPIENKASKCRKFITENLKSGPQSADMFWGFARSLVGDYEANKQVMQRAKNKLGVVVDQQGRWSLPEIKQENKQNEIDF